MKLQDLKIKNFGKFTDFEVVYNNKITRLVGLNGAGKTTVGLNAIWVALNGISEKSDGGLVGERWRFIGNAERKAQIDLTLKDERTGEIITIHRTITDSKNELKFEAPEGYKIDDDWIKGLLSTAFISGKYFSLLTGKQQTNALGINTERYDTEIKELKAEYTAINKNLKNYAGLVEKQKVEKLSISVLLNEKAVIDKFNAEQETRKIKISGLSDKIQQKKKELELLENELALIPAPLPVKETDTIISEINNAEVTNQRANEYDRYLEQKDIKDKLEKDLSNNKNSQHKKEQDKIDYIQSFKLGEGLTINDLGDLLSNGKPIKEPYFSKGELEVIVIKLFLTTKPELKVKFIDDFDLLDDKNQEEIIKLLLDNDFQVITAEVGDTSDSFDAVVLRECDYKNKGENNV